MPTAEPIAAVLAGGRARRLGGSKATIPLGGRPLIDYPLSALGDAGLEAVVIAKPGTPLPLLDVPVWLEREQPAHPLFGIVTALDRAQRPLLAVACDMPFVTAELVAHIAAFDAPLVVPEAGGRLHPLLARYAPVRLRSLRSALEQAGPLQKTINALEPATIGESELERFGDPARLLFNVNDAADLEQARLMIDG